MKLQNSTTNFHHLLYNKSMVNLKIYRITNGGGTMEGNETRQEIFDFFKQLGIENKEDRKKYSFGSSLLDDEKNDVFKIEHVILTPSKKEVLK